MLAQEWGGGGREQVWVGWQKGREREREAVRVPQQLGLVKESAGRVDRVGRVKGEWVGSGRRGKTRKRGKESERVRKVSGGQGEKLKRVSRT